MSDDLLARIARLRGSINDYKNDKKMIGGNTSTPLDADHKFHQRLSWRGRGRGRGRIRGGSRGPVRSNTLIVDNSNPDSEFISTKTSKGYKLINKAVYDEELERASMSKEQKKASLEEAKRKVRAKLNETRISKNKVKLDFCDRCLISGDLYSISRYGARLFPLNILEDESPTVQWNSYSYKRTKNGTLALENQKVHLKEQCRFFQKTGVCARGDQCVHAHNKLKVAICRRFIRGSCTVPDCPLTHEFNEFNTPICHFFLTNSCKNESCQFQHVFPELELVCRPFAIGGYCFRGKSCKFVHLFECPDYQLTRECPRGKNCKLTHSPKNNLDARLIFNTLNPEYFQLPDLTKKTGVHEDPRIQQLELEEDESKIMSDDDEDDDLNEYDTELDEDADFVHF